MEKRGVICPGITPPICPNTEKRAATEVPTIAADVTRAVMIENAEAIAAQLEKDAVKRLSEEVADKSN